LISINLGTVLSFAIEITVSALRIPDIRFVRVAFHRK
jgi:hypothetical protein